MGELICDIFDLGFLLDLFFLFCVRSFNMTLQHVSHRSFVPELTVVTFKRPGDHMYVSVFENVQLHVRFEFTAVRIARPVLPVVGVDLHILDKAVSRHDG